MSLHHLAEHINYELENTDHDEETDADTDIIVAALDRYVAPILTKTLDLISDAEKKIADPVYTHQIKMLKDEINDLLQGKFR